MIATLAFSFLVAFCVLGAVDGLYFHLVKYQLHLHPSSRTEHLIHTARAFLFVPIGYLLFAENTGGRLLMTALGLVLADLALEIVDIYIEKKAREPLGGVSSSETVVHVFASSFRMAAIALILVLKPADAFSLDSPSRLTESLPGYLRLLGLSFSAASLAGGVMSLLGMLWPDEESCGALAWA